MKKAIAISSNNDGMILQVEKWYSYTAYEDNKKGLCFIEKTTNVLNDRIGYGFTVEEKEWIQDFYFISDYKFEIASERQIRKYLKREALKRGFGIDIAFNPVNDPERIVVPTGDLRVGFDIKENKLLLNNRACFINGVWAIMPYKPIKLNLGIDFGKPDSYNDILTPHAMESAWLSEVFGVPEELFIKPRVVPTISVEMYEMAAKGAIEANEKLIKLQMKCETLEAENAYILAGGKSKWEKEIEELKTDNRSIKAWDKRLCEGKIEELQKANHELKRIVNFWQKECRSMRDFIEGIKNQSHNFLGMK